MYNNLQVQESDEAEPGPSQGLRNLFDTEVLCNPEGAVIGSSALVSLRLTCDAYSLAICFSFPGNLGIIG